MRSRAITLVGCLLGAMIVLYSCSGGSGGGSGDSPPPPATSYHLSGYVTTQDGSGVSGVTISIQDYSEGPARTATTNSSGYYYVGGLSACAYCVTPSKSGYTFSPPEEGFADPSAGSEVSFTAYPPPEEPRSLSITSPTGGETWTCGENATVTWSSTGPIAQIKISLWKGVGTTVTWIAQATANDGSLTWQVPTDVAPGSDYKVRIEDVDRSVSWIVVESPNYFTIQPQSAPHADLALSGLSVSPATVSQSPAWIRTNPNSAFTACSFTLTNNGPQTVSDPVVSYYLSTNTTLGDGDDVAIGDTGFSGVTLNSGDTYPIELSQTGLWNMTRNWPDSVAAGNYYVYAKVAVTSPSDPTPSNNYRRTTGTISYTGSVPRADLLLWGLSVTRPSDKSSRTFTDCNFYIRNNGPTALVSAGLMVDYYLSVDTTFGNADDRRIGDTGFAGTSIAVGETYPITLSSTGLANMVDLWTVGLVPSGWYYVFAKVRLTDSSPVDATPSNDYGCTGYPFGYSGN